MTPTEARSARRKRVAELRVAEPDLSLRQMAQRLGLSRDTVRRDLDDVDRQVANSATPVDEAATAVADPATPDTAVAPPLSQTAPQVSTGGAGSPADSAPSAEAAEQPVEPRPLPRRMLGPLEGIDVSRAAALRREMALLTQSGMSQEALVHQAIVAMAHTYRQYLDRGDLVVGQSFHASAMTLTPMAVARPAEQAG